MQIRNQSTISLGPALAILLYNCQVSSVFRFAICHAYRGAGTHSDTPQPLCRWAPVPIYIGACEKFDARATWKPNARAKHNLHKLGLKGHAHGQLTHTHMHRHAHSQTAARTRWKYATNMLITCAPSGSRDSSRHTHTLRQTHLPTQRQWLNLLLHTLWPYFSCSHLSISLPLPPSHSSLSLPP